MAWPMAVHFQRSLPFDFGIDSKPGSERQWARPKFPSILAHRLWLIYFDLEERSKQKTAFRFKTGVKFMKARGYLLNESANTQLQMQLHSAYLKAEMTMI